jgi:hypothetical protein
MTLSDLKTQLDTKLSKQFSARVLLDNLRLINESSRKTSPYTDPLYVPFYYHLGSIVQPKTLIEIGFRLGLFSACFFKGCKTVESALGFQEKDDDFYSPRLGIANVRQSYKKEFGVYVGSTLDDEFHTLLGRNQWGIAIFNEETGYDKHLAYLDLVWPHMELNGFLVMDYISRHTPAKQAFFDFCKSKSRSPVTFETRYGVGIVQK